jgi:hypothetical protein
MVQHMLPLSPLLTAGWDHPANPRALQGSDQESRKDREVSWNFHYNKELATGRQWSKYYTSERNSFSNNLTSTLSGSTPGEGSATQCNTPYTNWRWLRKEKLQTDASHVFQQPMYLRFCSLRGVILSLDFNNTIRIVSINNLRTFYWECMSVHSNGNTHQMTRHEVGEPLLRCFQMYYLSITDLPGASP